MGSSRVQLPFPNLQPNMALCTPQVHQANGEVERAVHTAKSILGKNDDIFSALLSFTSIPQQNGELLMGRRLQTTAYPPKQFVP